MVYIETLLIILILTLLSYVCSKIDFYLRFKEETKKQETELMLLINNFDNEYETKEDILKNKTYEVSILLIKLKSYYEKFLEYHGEQFETQTVKELKKSIKDIDNQLKEIGFQNKMASEKTLLEITIFDSKFSKN